MDPEMITAEELNVLPCDHLAEKVRLVTASDDQGQGCRPDAAILLRSLRCDAGAGELEDDLRAPWGCCSLRRRRRRRRPGHRGGAFRACGWRQLSGQHHRRRRTRCKRGRWCPRWGGGAFCWGHRWLRLRLCYGIRRPSPGDVPGHLHQHGFWFLNAIGSSGSGGRGGSSGGCSGSSLRR